MKARTAVLILLIVLLGCLAFFNFPTLAQNVPTSLGFTTVEAPLGLIMLGLTALLAIIFLVHALTMQGSWLLESRAHAKEMQAQRDLADKAEASRFTELRGVLEALHARDKQDLLARFDALEARLVSRAQESDNSTAAYVGQLEQQVNQFVQR